MFNRFKLIQKSLSYSNLIDINRNLSNQFATSNFKIGFIGTGKIAQAIILGLIKKEKLRPDQIYASDSNQDYIKHLKYNCPTFKNLKINFVDNSLEIFKQTNTVMLCVKPKDVPNLLSKVANKINKNHLILSIAAGIQLKQIQKSLPNETRIIRIMTNITALVQQSCSVFSKGQFATDEDAYTVKNLLEAIGTCEDEINEDLMDVVTALSGSGPAYMCLILDALADGAVKMGMSRQLAMRLAAKTMAGSANMIIDELNKNGKHVMSIKEEVCSPGGTSIHGISELENYGVRNGLIKCVESATNRAKELNPKD